MAPRQAGYHVESLALSLMRSDPYAHAPRLPDGDVIDPRELFHEAVEKKARPSSTPDVSPSRAEDLAGPVELEIGPGRGWFIFERLDHDPSVRILGLEIRRKWATIVDERLTKRGYGSRGRVFAEDAKLALPRLAARTISVAYLHFPDPWWKKRHQKRIVLGELVLEQLSRLLVPGGRFLIQTDVAERADDYERMVDSNGSFEPVSELSRITDHDYVARSPRERKAIEDGLPIVRLHYRLRS